MGRKCDLFLFINDLEWPGKQRCFFLLIAFDGHHPQFNRKNLIFLNDQPWLNLNKLSLTKDFLKSFIDVYSSAKKDGVIVDCRPHKNKRDALAVREGPTMTRTILKADCVCPWNTNNNKAAPLFLKCSVLCVFHLEIQRMLTRTQLDC